MRRVALKANFMLGGPSALSKSDTCKLCGGCQFDTSPKTAMALPPFRPWHIRDRTTLKRYIGSLSDELCEWLLVLYVDERLTLLAVETLAKGGVSEVTVNFRALITRGPELCASGYVLVHNHPSGDPRPSVGDVECTRRLGRLSAEIDMVLIEHVIVAGGEMRTICGDSLDN